MNHHDLKINSEYFKAVLEGRKTFEIRKNDRDYKENDTVTLNEVRYFRKTGFNLTFRIGFVTDYAQAPGYVVFSLLPIEK